MSEKVMVAIAYHSGYGHTLKVAEAVAKGAQNAGAEITLINVELIDESVNGGVSGWDTLNAADAIIFGAPTYMGSASGQFKIFAEKSSKIWYAQGWKTKIAAGFTNSGSNSGDKENTLVQMVTLASQHGMLWVSLGTIPTPLTDGSGDVLNRNGFYIGLGTQADNGVGPDLAPGSADLKTAEFYGARVAKVTQQWSGKAS